MGNRVLKTQIPRRLLRGKYSGYFWNYTIYMRDAQGNVMATYDMDLSSLSSGNIQEKYYLSEENIYGSLRVGMIKLNEYVAEREFEGSVSYDGMGFSESQNSTVVTNYDPDIVLFSFGKSYTDHRGDRYYELANHLGNVLEVITDRKIPEPDGSNNIDYYYADVVSYSDYYPGGMIMPGRSFSSDSYRNGFNGMESDDEISGEGNSYTTEYRHYDPRIMRWKSLDPAMDKYPGQSPYVAFNNNPIYFTDPFGDDPPEKLGAFARFKNWLGGDSQKNRANKYAVDNNIDEKNIEEKNGKVYITLEDSYKSFTTGEGEGKIQVYGEYEKTMIFVGDGTYDRTNESFVIYDPVAEREIDVLNDYFGPSCSDCPVMDPLMMNTGAASSSSIAEPFVQIAHDGVSGGLQKVGLNEEWSDGVASGIVFFGSVYAGGKISSGSGFVPKNRGWTYAAPQKAIIKSPLIKKVNGKYIDGFYYGNWRFQIHNHKINGQGPYPHINFGKDGKYHLFEDGNIIKAKPKN